MDNLPKPLGSYSHYKIIDKFVYIAGQGSRDYITNQEAGITIDESGKLITYDIKAQTRGCLDNLKRVLEKINLSLENVVDVTVFLKNMDDFKDYNDVYAQYFDFLNPPTRTTIGVLDLPGRNFIEIKAIAYIEDKQS